MTMERVARPEPLTRVDKLRRRFWRGAWSTTGALFVAMATWASWHPDARSRVTARAMATDAVLKFHGWVTGRMERLSFEHSVCASCGERGPCADWCVHYQQWSKR